MSCLNVWTMRFIAPKVMGAIKSWRHETGVSSSASLQCPSRINGPQVGRCAMGKTEIILTIIILFVIIFGFWFIFSGEIWFLVEYLENSIYPTFDAL
ncbi:Ecr family regulatory small membrane protein [Enterobacter ludwigii]|uniref:Ecr family regulatory small membrane protein n=1 Tax=Enterobacter ludwigii TaxID=299767 RepID=UPI003974A5C2